jgi:hypothetical protein
MHLCGVPADLLPPGAGSLFGAKEYGALGLVDFLREAAEEQRQRELETRGRSGGNVEVLR